MSHPSLGLPPSDPTAGLPDAAARILTNEPRLAARALRIAIDADPTIDRRFDETDRPDLAREYAEWTAPVYRRRGVSMDDVVALCEGLREAFPSVLAPGELPAAGAALDAAIKAYRWHRRIAGDARHKNALLQFLYKGG